MTESVEDMSGWLRAFLTAFSPNTYFSSSAEEDMRRDGVTRADVLWVIESCQVVAFDYGAAGIVDLTLLDFDSDSKRLRLNVRVENDVLRIEVVRVTRLNGETGERDGKVQPLRVA